MVVVGLIVALLGGLFLYSGVYMWEGQDSRWCRLAVLGTILTTVGAKLMANGGERL